MIVGFVLILSIVGIALATALYSNFLPYFSLLSDIKNYNMAYYGANTAIERSFLVLRYQEAGFEGQGGWIKNTNGIVQSDNSSNNFGYYTPNTTLLRSIIGRPTNGIIPGSNKGNVDYYFLSGGSNDYNTLSYRIPQRIPLRVDSTFSGYAYSGDTDRTFFNGSKVSFTTTLTPGVKEKFSNNTLDGWKLDDVNDIDGDGVDDDIIVDWGWKGQYSSDIGVTWSDFSILPRSLVSISTTGSVPTIQPDDESIREKDINIMSETNPPGTKIVFTTNINPLKDPGSINNLRNIEKPTHLMVADNSVVNAISDYDFEKMLTVNVNELKNQEINLFLTKNLVTAAGNIYPFLEYQVESDGDYISQPYFVINGKSQVGQYTVQMNVKKSINKDATLGSFTVVF